MKQYLFTSYPEVNLVLEELLPNVQAILGADLIGMYLDGSLATGDFDEDSDIDFVAITRGEISAEVFAALAAMHERIMGLDARLAVELEGSYIAQGTARRYTGGAAMYP
ncbi:MAG: nucleotidyltransferase domain-containing protein, partial [Anaerolineaceae bacterium]|nr:nucleotidyltransferase domain-containing protein [Anaerolineaceae bacterium]